MSCELWALREKRKKEREKLETHVVYPFFQWEKVAAKRPCPSGAFYVIPRDRSFC
jgi:hypothetical protein